MTEAAPRNDMESRAKKHSNKAAKRVEPSRRAMLQVKRSILKKLCVRMSVGMGRKNK
jgi:hypothetical protein